MGHQAIIYGRIQGERDYSQGRRTRIHEYNAAVVHSLPDRDEGWPFLTRHMFAVGEHRVIFGTLGDSIEIIHRASNRDIFAKGSIEAAKWAAGAKPGLCSAHAGCGGRWHWCVSRGER